MYLFFDTETTGLPQDWNAPVTELDNWPRLVQIAWILFDELGREIDKNDHIIKPSGFNIPYESSSVHGITDDIANLKGVGLEDVLNEFDEQIQKAKYLVAHNIAFDEKIMGAEFLRYRMVNSIDGKKKICTMEKTTDYVAIQGYYGNKWPSLSELHRKLFGEDFEEAHDASADIKATARCFWEAKRLGVL